MFDEMREVADRTGRGDLVCVWRKHTQIKTERALEKKNSVQSLTVLGRKPIELGIMLKEDGSYLQELDYLI